MIIAERKERQVSILEAAENNQEFLRSIFMGCSNGTGHSKLQKYIEQVLFETPSFLKHHVGFGKGSVKELSGKFTNTLIRRHPRIRP